ncbi:MAG: tetratricopeptide repeat protein, partial [bacterium]|nr:tetratricopeptide repeat protein [bacterium]
MVDWIKKNKQWLFSGVAVSIPLTIVGWLWFQGGDPPPVPPDNSTQQTHSGTGDNVGRDKNVTTDNSGQQINIGATNVAGRDQTINNYLLGSVDYRQLVQDIKDAQEMLAVIPSDKINARLKQSAKVKELKQRLEDFKAEVFRLHELFTRIPINTERLRKAKEHFDKGEFREADAVLKAEEIQRDVERLKKEQGAATEKLAAIERDLEDRAQEFLLKARLSLLSPVPEGGSRFERAQGWFEQALATARTAELLGEYAVFLWEHNDFGQAEPLYQEALKHYRGLAESNPEAFLPDVATTLNNLANLHSDTQAYGPALKEYEEALKIRRGLAESSPEDFLPDVATTLNNLAILHKATQAYGPALKEYEEALKIRRSLAESSP